MRTSVGIEYAVMKRCSTPWCTPRPRADARLKSQHVHTPAVHQAKFRLGSQHTVYASRQPSPPTMRVRSGSRQQQSGRRHALIQSRPLQKENALGPTGRAYWGLWGLLAGREGEGILAHRAKTNGPNMSCQLDAQPPLQISW